jgi:Uma2 family endonuclease
MQADAIQTFDNLPSNLYSDEPGMESDRHLQQMLVLISSLELLWQDRNDFYLSGNITVYYDLKKIETRDFRGPDFMVALDVERYPRRSWSLWEEGGKYPNLVVEILSESTADIDRNAKKEFYQDTFRIIEYFWVDPDTQEFEGFFILGGSYQPILPNELGHRWSQQLQLFLGIYNSQLRYFTPEGQLVPTPVEAAQAAQQEAKAAQQEAQTAQQEAQTAQQEAQTAQQAAQAAQQEAQAAQQAVQETQRRNDQLAAKLRDLGIDPSTL